MSKVIVYYCNESQKCKVIFPTNEISLEDVINKDVPRGYSYLVIEKEALLPLRSLSSWEMNNGNIHINMDKAKSSYIDELRIVREQKFIDLGFPYRLDPSLESSIIPDETRNKLKELRDFPKNIDLSSAKTIDELYAIIPECLR